MIDGVLNNTPSLGELEAKAKAGEQISLTDLAAAVKAEEKAPKAKKSHTAKPKKPSIRVQLDAAKKEQSKQTQPREKAADDDKAQVKDITVELKNMEDRMVRLTPNSSDMGSVKETQSPEVGFVLRSPTVTCGKFFSYFALLIEDLER